jgi:general secretion pathway protein A
MYTSFYKLKAKPFQISSDPEFMWFGEKHKEALATLKYGVLDNKGFLLLTGDVGTGKTTLINALIQSLSDDVICSSVTDPNLSKLDFFNYIASSFGINQEFSTKGSFLIGFRKFLMEAHEKNKKVLLIIDESQLLTQELLEEIRLLSNIEKANTKLINIFFIGQNEFNEILNKDQNRAVRQRLTLNYNLDPLTPDETQKYIQHRLKVAGAKNTIFDSNAVQEVFMYSGGFPRRINVICDHALLSGYVNDSETISAQIVQECARELKIPTHIKNRDINGFESNHSKPLPNIQSRSIVLQPRTLEKKKKETGNIIMLFIAVSLFALICWWMLFPVSFGHFISSSSNQISLLKNQISLFLPELPTSSQLPEHDDILENNEVIKKVENSKRTFVQPKDHEEAEDYGKTDIKNEIDSSNNDQALKISQDQIESEKSNVVLLQDKKKQQTTSTLIQNNFEKRHNSKDESEDLLKLSDRKPAPAVSVASVESVKERDVNPLDQIHEIKKAILPLPKEKIIIRFRYNANDFTQAGFEKLKKFTDIVTMHPDVRVLISGYTDSNGNQQYNVKLSEFRANIVRSFLLGRGVPEKQIKIKGLGSLNPIENNDTSWGRMMNRRVEIEIIQ